MSAPVSRTLLHDSFGLVSPAPEMRTLRAVLTAAQSDADLTPYMSEHAVLFTDLSGWSTSPSVHEALQRVLRMENALRDSLASCGGILVKAMGDSHLVLYAVVNQAIRCIDALRGAMPDHPFCAGIGYGPMLICHHLHNRLDAFGLEVSLASRLGEDVATGSQVLLSKAAYASLGSEYMKRCVPATSSTIPCWELRAEENH